MQLVVVLRKLTCRRWPDHMGHSFTFGRFQRSNATEFDSEWGNRQVHAETNRSIPIVRSFEPAAPWKLFKLDTDGAGARLANRRVLFEEAAIPPLSVEPALHY